MAPLLEIDTSLWATSGAATELSTRGGAATGIGGLDANWTHGSDSNGNYIEHANTGGSDDLIDIIDSGSIFGSVGDRVRIQAGIMLIKNSTIDYTDLGGGERFFDTVSGERSIFSLRHGTNFYSGEGFRFEGAEFGGTSTEDGINASEGLKFSTLYEFAIDCEFDDPGWVRMFVDGVEYTNVDSGANGMSGINADRIAQWKIPDVPDDRVTYRIYGDRDGMIRVITDDFEFLPKYSEEANSDCIFRFADVGISETENDRGFWIWSDAAEVTSVKYATGGTNPARRRFVVTSTGSTGSLRQPFETINSTRMNMVLINGLLINSGGSLSIVFTTGSELGRIIFEDGNVKIKHGVYAAQNIMTYSDSSRYCLRLNRYDGKLRVGLEDLSNNFETSETIQYADIDITNSGGLASSHYENIDFIANDCEIDGITGMVKEFSGLVSSFVGADVSGLAAPTQHMFNRTWAAFPRAWSSNLFPGYLAREYDLSSGYAFTTIGRSGNEITDFVDENSAALPLFAGHSLVVLEWIINDLSPVRTIEGSVITTRDEIFAKMETLVDSCIENNITLWIGKAIKPPLGESGQNWQSYVHDAYDYLNTNVKAMLLSKNRPDLLFWSEFDDTITDYYLGSNDDVHFILGVDGSGDRLYTANFMANLLSAGSFGRSLSTLLAPSSTPSPTFSVDGSSYDTRFVDANIESMVEQVDVSGSSTVTLETVHPDYEVRYTVNGKNPTSKSNLYVEPLTITRNLTGSDNTIIKARIYHRLNSNIKSRIVKIRLRIV